MAGDTSFVGFIENAFGADVGELTNLIGRNPDVVLQQRETVLGLLDETWAGPELSENRESERAGELWPVLPEAAPDVVGLARRVYRGSTRFGTATRAAEASRRDIQSLLLYAHGLHMPNPFRRMAVGAPDDQAFLGTVGIVCAIAPLVEGGVIRVHEPIDRPSLHLTETVRGALDDLAGHVGLALMSYEGNRQMQQDFLRQAADVLMQRALEHLMDLGGRDEAHEGTLLLPTPYDAPALQAVATVLGRLAPNEDDHRLRLNRLVDLSLPGLDSLDLTDMVAIRGDESFGVFRADISAALIDVDDDVRHGRLDSAQRTVAEHMDAGLARLSARTRKGILGDSLIGGLVGWGLGAAVASSLAGFKGFLASLAGRAVSDAWRKWPSQGQRALRSHYVELGTSSRSVTTTPVDFLAFSTEQLWGPSLAAPRRAATRQAIVGHLLDDVLGEQGE